MIDNHLSAIRSVIKFVIAWLIAVYLVEVMVESKGIAIGLSASIVALIVNAYSRKRAAAHVQAGPEFYFWLYLPVFLLFVVPLAVRIVVVWSDEDAGWWDHLWSAMPFLLKLTVPVGALIWVYVALGRHIIRMSDSVDAAIAEGE